MAKTRLSSRAIEPDRRRAGVDCTFSAPKSVSLAALVGGDRRIVDAHRLAVERTLSFIERHYSQTRIRSGSDRRQVVTTGNLIVAEFDHIENRELNPHLHTHCVAMNATQLKDGRWFSHLNTQIYVNERLLGRLYRQELALELQQLGYELEKTQEGMFELKGFTPEQLQWFSQRRQQILERTGESADWRERNRAWRSTRRVKEDFDGDALQASWQQEARALGMEFPQPQGQPQAIDPSEIDEQLQRSLTLAIAHCSERQVAFRPEDLMAFIFSEMQPFGVARLETAIAGRDDTIELQDDKRRLTTEAALAREVATIWLMRQGMGQVEPLASAEAVERHLDGKGLTEGQQEAVRLAATTTDRFIAWQGVAGAGKTFALNELTQLPGLVQELGPGIQVRGFAPSAEAAKVLADEVGIESRDRGQFAGESPAGSGRSGMQSAPASIVDCG